MNAIRQFALIPMLLLTVVDLVSFSGSDAVSLCLNTVAVVFILEVDNLSYEYALEEQTRAQVEEHALYIYIYRSMIYIFYLLYLRGPRSRSTPSISISIDLYLSL